MEDLSNRPMTNKKNADSIHSHLDNCAGKKNRELPEKENCTQISDLENDQKELCLNEKSYCTIFETAGDPIFLSDMKTGAIIDVNPAACRHLGYDRSELLKMSLVQIQGDDSAVPLCAPVDKQRIFSSSLDETVHIRKDGSKAIVEVSRRPMTHQGRTVLLSIARDITRRRQREQKLAHSRENLEKDLVDRTKALKEAQNELVKCERLAVLGQLTATVSHELRNPLGVIRSSNFFLRRKIKHQDEKTDKHFKRIDEQITLCDSIVADLLEYTRGRNVSILKQDIAPLLSEIVEQFQEQQNIDISMHLAESLPPLPHDQEKMRRVMINLLTNAILAVNAKFENDVKDETKYQPNINIEADLEGDDLIIRVRDNGIGMDAQTLKRAYEPLFTTRVSGTGIGLAIVKKIIEEHGGTIDMESRLGEGTLITLSLPYRSQIENVSE